MPIAPAWIFSIASSSGLLWRLISPPAIFRFLALAASPARSTRRMPGASTANDFSMKTFTPLLTAYSKCIGRKAACVVRSTTSPGPSESMAFLYASKPMNARSEGTSILSGKLAVRFLRLAWSRSGKMSAMACSFTWPPVVEKASATAPVPRPPQPTRASLIVSEPAAWQWGTAAPARAPAAVAAAVVRRNSRRVTILELVVLVFIANESARIVDFPPSKARGFAVGVQLGAVPSGRPPAKNSAGDNDWVLVFSAGAEK